MEIERLGLVNGFLFFLQKKQKTVRLNERFQDKAKKLLSSGATT